MKHNQTRCQPACSAKMPLKEVNWVSIWFAACVDSFVLLLLSCDCLQYFCNHVMIKQCFTAVYLQLPSSQSTLQIISQILESLGFASNYELSQNMVIRSGYWFSSMRSCFIVPVIIFSWGTHLRFRYKAPFLEKKKNHCRHAESKESCSFVAMDCSYSSRKMCLLYTPLAPSIC